MCLLIKNSPLLTCTFYTLSAVGCSHYLHYPEAAEDTSDRMEGLGKMGILLKCKLCDVGIFAVLISLLMMWWSICLPTHATSLTLAHKDEMFEIHICSQFPPSACCHFIVDI